MLGNSNPFDFSGKVVLVTGSGHGIGRSIAEAFTSAGANLALHYHTSQVEANEMAAGMPKAQVFQADLTNADEVAALFRAIEQGLGGVDVLVNNAGSYPVRFLTEMTSAEWEAVLQTNLHSVFLTTQAAAKAMILRRQPGAIINISSVEAFFPAEGHAHYAAAKAGLLALTRSAALELGKYGIRVNALSLGLIARPGIEQSWQDGVERWLKAAPLGRMGTPQDVAQACLFLASPAAAWITGANLPVDGGVSCRPAF